MGGRDGAVEVLLHERQPAAGAPAVETPRRGPRLSRRGWWVLGIAAGSALGAVVGYLIADQVQQRHQFDRSHAALTVTQHHISTVSAELASVQHDLAGLKTQVGADTTALTQAESQLKGAQSALSSAQAQVTQQTSTITSLQTCLGGVEQALNALAINNQLRAFALLESVSSSCTTAAAASG